MNNNIQGKEFKGGKNKSTKAYKDNFLPHLEYSNEEDKHVCSKYYIEVGRECYHYTGLKNKKNNILVYSAILAGLNNSMSTTFSYNNNYIAVRLSMNDREVRRAIGDLVKLDLIKVTHPSKNKRNIKVLKDLRYPINEDGKKKRKKSVIKVYDRIFYYPAITKPMVHVYSYYLALTNIPGYPGYSNVSYKKVSETLGYSERQVISILKEMNNIGLIDLTQYKNYKLAKLKVDFSMKQPEETAYEESYAKMQGEWKQKSPIAEIEHEIKVLEAQQKKLNIKMFMKDDNQNEFIEYKINKNRLKELKEKLNEIQAIPETDSSMTTSVLETN